MTLATEAEAHRVPPPPRMTFAPASADIIEAVAALVRERGEPEAIRLLTLSRLTIARVLGGLRVRAGTLALVRERLAAVTAVAKVPDAR